MVKVVALLVGGALSCVVAGCEDQTKQVPQFSAQAGAGPTGGAGALAGSGPVAGTNPSGPCQTGGPCPCEGGLQGVVSMCTSQANTCNCACAADATVPTVEAPTFVVCAGDPIGSWRLTAVDSSAVGFEVASSQCPADHDDTRLPRMLVHLLADGTGDVFYGGLSSPVTVLESCIAERTGLGTTCSRFAGCRPKGCGLCACGDVDEPYGFFPYAPGWEVAGGTLRLTGNGGDLSVPYDFCVEGAQLTLRPQGGEQLLRLERVEIGGAPTPCAERSADRCALPVVTDPARKAESEDDMCRVGACVGDNVACATAVLETDCTVPGCTWDVTKCSGIPAQRCLFGDYGIIPGCEITPVVAP